ncbi:MAG: alpha/beta fold hydrolase [Bacteroidota bacterium]
MQEALIKIKAEDGAVLALWKSWADENANGQHILLTHGTFSNRKVLKGITTYLVSQGFTCWSFEWRNHGASSPSPSPFDFETIGQKDFPLILDFLFDTQGISHLHAVTHSGGGICLTLALIAHPQYRDRFRSISMFACQAFGAAHSRVNHLQILLGKYASKTLGYIPAQMLGGEENEPYHFMQQWFDWNLTKEFIGRSGIDYKVKMKDIKVPIFAVFGEGDLFIAPPVGCKQFLAAFDNPQNQSLLCGKVHGFAENYNHSRILHSRAASREIYPAVLDWIHQHI